MGAIHGRACSGPKLRVFWTEPSRLGVIGGRSLVSLQPGLREAPVVEGSGVFGFQPNRLGKVGDRVLVSAPSRPSPCRGR